MQINQYQKLAARTLKSELSQEETIKMCCFGLAGEVGETIDLLKKHIYHGHALSVDELSKELGDVLWYISGIATAHWLSLNDIALMNIDKLQKRYPDGFSQERSINREENESV